MADNEAASFVSGVAVHWYSDANTNPTILDDVYRKYLAPNKFILGTEACDGWIAPQGPLLGDWERGEHYAHDIITV